MTGSSYAAALRDLPPGAADLARHAAVPVVVDAGFLNLLRVNFFVDPPFVLPYEVEAELLLSPLFREVGEGLYEIDPERRNTLLTELVAQFGTDRLGRVAGLLEQYTDHAVAWHALPELENAQRLTALSLLDAPRAQAWLEREKAEAKSIGTPLASVWFVAMENRLREHQIVLESADRLLPGRELQEFIDELARLFDRQPLADALLEEIGFPLRGPSMRGFGIGAGTNRAWFWSEITSDLDSGRVPGLGLRALAEAAFKTYPANPVFRRTVNALRLLDALIPLPQNWPTLVFFGTERYDVFITQVLELLGPDAEQLYGAGSETAVFVPDRQRAEAMANDAEDLARRMVPGSEIEVRFQEFDFRPYLIPTLHLLGPDRQEFLAEQVPAIALVRDLEQALLDMYAAEWSEDRRRQAPTFVVELEVAGEEGEPAQTTRLDLDQTLHESGLKDGDRLRIAPRSVSSGGGRTPEPSARDRRMVASVRLTASEPDRAERPGGVWPTLLFNGSRRHDAIMQLVHEQLGPQPRPFYATATETAVYVPDRDRAVGLVDELTVLARRIDPGIQVLFREFDFEPYLIQTLTILGPDQRAFPLNDIPATTPVNDIPRMISDRYAAEVWEEYFGGYQIAVEHLVPPPVEGSFRFMRLDPAQTLHEAGVERGDQLRLQSDLTPADAAARYHQLGVLALDRGDSEEAERRFRQSLDIQEQLGVRRDAAATYHQLGLLAQGRGDHAEAERRHHQALDVFREWGDHAGAAASCYQLGMAVLSRGDTLESERWHQQALSHFEELGDRERVADSYYQLGILAQMKGDLAEAERRHLQALTIEMDMGNRAGAAVSYHHLGILARTRRDFAEAEHRQQQALGVFTELGVRDGIAASYHELAVIAQLQGRHGEAERRHQQALTAYEEIGNRSGVANTVTELGNLRLATGDLAQAVVLHCQALTIRRDLGLSPASYDLAPLLELRRLLGEEAFTNLASPRLGTLTLRELKALLDRA